MSRKMNVFGVALASVLSLSYAVPVRNTRTKSDLELTFRGWMSKFEMEFEDDAEFLLRQGIFANNLKTIDAHNAGNHTWKMGLNRFAHLTPEEFKARNTMTIAPPGNLNDPTLPRRTFVSSEDFKAPDSVDWVANGAVTKVKNQESCGSCWSFSSTGALEGAYFNKYGTLKSFSEEMLVQCDSTDDACEGGLMERAFEWIRKNGGLCTEDAYPYTSGSGTAGVCHATCDVVPGSAPTGYVDVSRNPQVVPCTEDELMEAVAKQPVSIAVDAEATSFQFYESGVMTGHCGAELDHGVLVVGYGTDAGSEYWKIKNSWGEDWGEEGYIRIKRGDESINEGKGQCGLLLTPTYPEL